MSTTANLKNVYAEQIAPALMKQFNYSSPMQIPVLKKIVVNQGLGMATADKKVIEVAMTEIAQITGQKPVATLSKKDVSNFHLRKKMPIGVMVTLRRQRTMVVVTILLVFKSRLSSQKSISTKLIRLWV